MKRIINLIFDRLERLMWQRHVLWTLRKNNNHSHYLGYEGVDANILNDSLVDWIRLHMNDYRGWKGNATETENSTEVNDEAS